MSFQRVAIGGSGHSEPVSKSVAGYLASLYKKQRKLQTEQLKLEAALKSGKNIDRVQAHYSLALVKTHLAQVREALESAGASLAGYRAVPGAAAPLTGKKKKGETSHVTAMRAIDRYLPRLDQKQRATVDGFIRRQSTRGVVPAGVVRAAINMANAGRFKLMRPWQELVDPLPFNLDDFMAARNNRTGFVLHKSGEHHLPFRMAEKYLARQLGLTVEELRRSPTLIASIYKGTYQAPVDHASTRIDDRTRMLAEAVREDGLAGYLKSPAAGFRILPEWMQDVAGETAGLKRGQALTDEEIQNHLVGQVGKALYHQGIGMVAAPVVNGADIAETLGDVLAYGLLETAKRKGQAFLESLNVFDPNISAGERALRFANLYSTAKGLNDKRRRGTRPSRIPASVRSKRRATLPVLGITDHFDPDEWLENISKRKPLQIDPDLPRPYKDVKKGPDPLIASIADARPIVDDPEPLLHTTIIDRSVTGPYDHPDPRARFFLGGGGAYGLQEGIYGRLGFNQKSVLAALKTQRGSGRSHNFLDNISRAHTRFSAHKARIF